MVAMCDNAKVNIMSLVYLGFVVASGLFAVNISEWLYVVLRTVLFVTYISVVDIDKKLLAKSMILLGVFYVLYFWVDYMNSDGFIGCRGLMRQRNHWAFAQFLVVPFCYYAISNGFWRKTANIIMFLMSVNIILLSSRTAILALLIAGYIMLCDVMANKHARGWIRRDKTWIIASLIFIAIFFPWKKFADTETMRYRIEQWKSTASMIASNPTGVGAGNWSIKFPEYAKNIDYPTAYNKKSFRFPHNDYLWTMAETGILGGCAYIAMFATAIYYAFKKKEAWLLMALGGYVASSMFTAHYERPFATLMAATFIAMSYRTINVKWKKFMIIPLVFVIVVFGFRYRSSQWNKKLRSSNNWQEVLDCTKGYSVFSTLTYTGLPYHWWGGMAHLKMNNQDMAAVSLEKAYKYNTGNIHVINGYGISKAISGDIDEAKKQFKYALSICPEFKDAKDNLAKVK